MTLPDCRAAGQGALLLSRPAGTPSRWSDGAPGFARASCAVPARRPGEARPAPCSARLARGAGKSDDGSFKGQLKTLSIRAEIEIVANARKTSDVQPDYRVLSDGIEIGAGWMRRAESSGRDYVSLSLAAPEFGPRRLYANLG